MPTPVADTDRPNNTRQHAQLTRASIVESAAREFARCGYAAASVNSIVAECGYAKGAMYFHFASKADLASAVIDAAAERYVDIGERWSRAPDHPFDALAALAGDLAAAFASEWTFRAEVRLSIAPELAGRTGRR